MPYEIKMRDGKHCVVKQGTDDSIGCHDTHGEAVAQIAAVNANEGAEEAWVAFR